MKKVTLFLLVSLFITNSTYASFPVKSDSEETEKVSNISKDETSTNAQLTETKVSKHEARVAQKIEKIQSKLDKKAGDDKTVAIILGLISVLLFPFALHNWYLGKNKKALWQCLMVFPGFILLGLPLIASWIWQLIDLIIIIAKGV